jgi:hypothetical protein
MAALQGTIQVSLPNLQRWRAEAIMVNTELEQRRLRRHMVRMPVSVRWSKGDVGGTVLALVRDISERGVFLYLDARIPEGAKIEYTLALPQEIVGDTTSVFHCKGQVVRLEEPLGGKSGIGARITQYAKVPKTPKLAPGATQASQEETAGQPADNIASKLVAMPEGAGNKSQAEVAAPSVSPYRAAEAAAPFFALVGVLVLGLLYAAWFPAKEAVVLKPVADPDARVWVYSRTGQYYCPGSAEYEKLEPGKLMSQAHAQNAYYRPAGEVCQ